MIWIATLVKPLDAHWSSGNVDPTPRKKDLIDLILILIDRSDEDHDPDVRSVQQYREAVYWRKNWCA